MWVAANSNSPDRNRDRASDRLSPPDPGQSPAIIPCCAYVGAKKKKKEIIVKEENSARVWVAKRRDGYSASARYTLQRCAIAALQQAQSITTLQSLHSPHSLRFPLHSLHWGEWACAHVLRWLLELSIRDKTLRIAQLLCTGLLHLAVSSPSSVIQVESRSSCLHLPAGLRSALAVWLVSGGLKVAVQAWIDV